MILRLEDETVLEDPDEDQISASLGFLLAPGNTFAVLSHGPWTSLRAERDPRYRFTLRGCDGTPEDRLRTVSDRLDLATVQEVCLRFARREPDWKEGLDWQPDFFSVLADPESPHFERLRQAARTLRMQAVQTFGVPPSRVSWDQLEPLADRMARRVARELADEEERFRPYREAVHRDVRAALLGLLRSADE